MENNLIYKLRTNIIMITKILTKLMLEFVT